MNFQADRLRPEDCQETIAVSATKSELRTQHKDPLRSALALCIKELIWRFAIRFTPRRRPIAIYASRRSGSSLLMEVIGVNPGILYSDQPFGIYTASSANINLLPIFPAGQIAHPDPQEQALLENYVCGLLSGEIRANLPWKFWQSEFHFFNDRLCLKITDAKTMIEWLAERFDLETVVLTRHPIAQAVSVASVGWYPTGKGLLRNRGYVEAWLNDELESYSWDLYRRGSELEWRVLDWALENRPMLQCLPAHPEWHFVSYEDLIVHAPHVIGYLSERLQLSSPQKMLARVRKPSRSTRRESTAERKRLIAASDRQQLVSSWQSQVDAQQLAACFQILDRFEIDLYQPDRPMPDPSRLQRQGFAERAIETLS